MECPFEVEAMAGGVRVSSVGRLTGLHLALAILKEDELAVLIEALKKAKDAAWPRPKRAVSKLCPASAELLSYLRQHSNITPIKAREELGIEHLPRRVKDLKECGFNVKTRLKRSHSGKRYARYELQSGDAQ